jgi:acetylglutamate kinase
MDKLYIIKIGGNIIDDEQQLSSFLQTFASLDGYKVLVHGGGKLATQLATQLNVPQQLIEGRRVTNEATLKVVTMVYAGYINKNILSQLHAFNCNAIGLSGVDGNMIQAHKRTSADYGFVGDIDKVDGKFIHNLLKQDLTPVIAPITHDGKGQLLNTNADTIAQEVAKEMSSLFQVVLVYAFDKPGVMKNINDEASVIPVIDGNMFSQLKEDKIVSDGMIPKLQNAFDAITSGVNRVIIGNAALLKELVNSKTGTTIQ